MVCAPTDRVLVVKVAVSVAVLVRVPVPMDGPEARRVRVPVGLAAAWLPGALTVTVAVKVTDWSEIVGLVPDVTVVVVLALLSVWPMEAEAGLALKLPSPLV